MSEPESNYSIVPQRPDGNNDATAALLDPLIDGNESLDDIRTAYEKMTLEHEKDLHNIRKNHLDRLFYLTCVWSGLVVYILISLGLGRLLWFSATPSHHTDISPFKLEPSVIIAFITSTTATIIGLYTIAAYWLFKKKE